MTDKKIKAAVDIDMTAAELVVLGQTGGQIAQVVEQIKGQDKVVVVGGRNVTMTVGTIAHAMFASGASDFLVHSDHERRFAMLPELGMPYGGGTDSGKTTTDPYEAFAEYARGDADLDRRMRVIDDPQMPVEAIVGDEVPDHISIERKNPHYDPIVDNLGVRIDGIEQDSVVEYCVSGGWVRIGERDHHGKLIWEFDHYRARRVEGVKIEPYWRRALSRQQRRARAAKTRKAR